MNHNTVMGSVMDSFTPAEATELCSRAGVKKANMRIDKIFFSAVYAGMLLSFAGATHLSIQASPWFQTNAPGLIRAIGALYFPYGTVPSQNLELQRDLFDTDRPRNDRSHGYRPFYR